MSKTPDPPAGAACGGGNRVLVAALLALTFSQTPPAARAADVAAGGARPLAAFPSSAAPIGEWMKEQGWKTQRGDPKRFQVGGGRLAMVSDDDTVAIGTQRGFPVRPQEWPVVRFEVQVTALPAGAGLAKKKTDDAAFRLFVAFDRDKGLVSPPHTIAYTWSNDLAPGTVVQSGHFKNLRYLVIGKGLTKPGRWVAVERDLLADYRRVFPEAAAEGDVPALSGILLKCDSNNTGTKAASAVRGIELAAGGD